MNKVRWGILVITLALLGYLLGGGGLRPAYAATPNGCQVVGTVGNVIVAICIDPNTNAVSWANSAGMLAPVQ